MVTHREALKKADHVLATMKHNGSLKDLEDAIRAYLDARGLVVVDKAIMAAMAEGYHVNGHHDHLVTVENPAFSEGSSKDPFLVFDLHADPFQEDSE